LGNFWIDIWKDSDTSGLIENNAGLINDNTGLITKTNDVEYIASGRKKRSKEREKDSEPRNYLLHTMKNITELCICGITRFD